MEKLKNFGPQIFIGLLALLLTIFSLKSGYFHGDFLQNNILRQQDFSQTIFKTSVTLEPSKNLHLVQQGRLPWWTTLNAKIAFFRPVTEIAHFIDFLLWPNSPELMHLQSILWYVVVCSFSFVFFYKITKSRDISLLAAYLFTVDFNHFTIVTWLSDRSRLIVLFFGLATVILFHLWRVQKREYFKYLSYGSFLIALYTSESGIVILGYIFAYALFIEGLKLKKAAVLLSPYIVLFIGWWIMYSVLGYGVKSTGFYTNPLHEPIHFIRLALERVPVLFMEQWFKPSMFVPTDLWAMPGPTLYNLLPDIGRIFYWALSLIVMLAVAAIFYRYLKNDKVARFFLASSIFSLFLASTTVLLEGRLLIFAGVSISGILAIFICRIFLENIKHSSIGVYIFIILTIVIQGVISPIKFFTMTTKMNPMKEVLENLTNIPTTQRNLAIFVINSPSPTYLSYRPSMSVNNSQPPAQVLAPGYKSLIVKRTAANTLEITATKPIERADRFYWLEKKNAYKDHDTGINMLGFVPEKKIYIVNNIKIKVLESDKEDGSVRVNFTFNLPLGDDSYTWVKWSWDKNKYESFSPPQVGETIML